MKLRTSALSAEECKRVHDYSIRIPEEVGIKVPSEKLLSMLEATCELIKYNVPVLVFPMPCNGTTGPASLYANIAMANAEAISCFVIFQLVNPDAPLLYGAAFRTDEFYNPELVPWQMHDRWVKDGATGGVMEAALRSACFLITGENPPADAFQNVRGMDGWKEATFTINGIKLSIAITNGLGNARKLMEAIRAGEVRYDFVEVMACPGGCAGGGGQPIHDGCEMAETRGLDLYAIDRADEMRFSHENPSVAMSYEEYFEKPLSEKAHHLLHTDVSKWTL